MDLLLFFTSSSARSGKRDLNMKKTSQKSESSYSLTSGE